MAELSDQEMLRYNRQIILLSVLILTVRKH